MVALGKEPGYIVPTGGIQSQGVGLGDEAADIALSVVVSGQGKLYRFHGRGAREHALQAVQIAGAYGEVPGRIGQFLRRVAAGADLHEAAGTLVRGGTVVEAGLVVHHGSQQPPVPADAVGRCPDQVVVLGNGRQVHGFAGQVSPLHAVEPLRCGELRNPAVDVAERLGFRGPDGPYGTIGKRTRENDVVGNVGDFLGDDHQVYGTACERVQRPVSRDDAHLHVNVFGILFHQVAHEDLVFPRNHAGIVIFGRRRRVTLVTPHGNQEQYGRQNGCVYGLSFTHYLLPERPPDAPDDPPPPPLPPPKLPPLAREDSVFMVPR